MTITRRAVFTGAFAAAALAGLTACGASSGGGATAGAPGKPLTIVADSVPHSELLKQVESLKLLGDVKIEVREIAGGVDPNQLVASGDVDANFFQHVPYLKDWNGQHSGDLVVAATTHVEPLGLYSKKVKNVADTPESAVIAIPSDATNLGRALFVLEQAGLIKLNVKPTDANLDISQVGEANITENPKKISFIKIDRPQLAASLDDALVTLSIVNGNYALEAGLTPATDALTLEKAENNPYANIVAVKPGLKDDPRVKKLAEALTSTQIKEYIEKTYKGSVLPA